MIHISNGVSKLGTAIPSINFPPVITCNPDAPCFKQCYARKGRFSFSHNKSLLQQNLDAWNKDKEGFERELINAFISARFVRYFSSGDIPDGDFLRMMDRIAEKLPNTEFLCFTKKYELVNSYIELMNAIGCSVPQNLHIVLSAWGDWIPYNPYNLPVAYVHLKSGEGADKIPDNAIPCSKYCAECVKTDRSCWCLRNGQSVVFEQH